MKKSNVFLDLAQVDTIKVYMMIMVIFGHSVALWLPGGWVNAQPYESSRVISYIADYIIYIHTYVFTFASGYLFFYQMYEVCKYNNVYLFIKKRFKRLIIPYIVIAIIWAIPIHIVFFGFSLNEIIKNYLFMINPDQLWFLPMLLCVSIIMYCLSHYLNKSDFSNGLLLVLVVYLLSLLLSHYIPNIFQIWKACKYLFFYYLGFEYRKRHGVFSSKIGWKYCFLINIILYTSLTYCDIDNIYFFRMLEILCSAFGVLMVVNFFASINDNLVNTKFFRIIQKHNFTMFLFHQQIIYFVINTLNGKVPNSVLIVTSFFTSFVISLSIASVIYNIPPFGKLLGYHYVKADIKDERV